MTRGDPTQRVGLGGYGRGCKVMPPCGEVRVLTTRLVRTYGIAHRIDIDHKGWP